MKIFFFILIFSASIFSHSLWALEVFDYQWVFRTGFLAQQSKMHTTLREHLSEGDEDSESTFSFGMNSSIGYKFDRYEPNIASNIYYGKIRNMKFPVGNDVIEGKGSTRGFSINPNIKYSIIKKSFENWEMYLRLGPVWSLQTIVFTSTARNFSTKKRITFENYGASFGFGIEEKLPFKEMHPVYLELIYSYFNSYETSLVDASDFQNINIISQEKSNDRFGASTFTLNFGIALF